MRNHSKAYQLQIEIQSLLDREKKELKQLGLSEETIEKLCNKFYQEAIQQGYMSNSSYILNELRKYKSKL